MSKIKEQELFRMGWVRFGDDEDDPFYRFHSNVSVLGTQQLSGNYTKGGGFEIYGVPQVFASIENLKKWVAIVGFMLNVGLTERLKAELSEHN
jgi:hypothetical protein